MNLLTREGMKLNVDIRVAAGAAAALLAGGGVGGYFLCRRLLVRAYAEQLETEVEATRRHFYGQLAKEGLLDVEAEQLPASDSSSDGLVTDGRDNASPDSAQEGEEDGSVSPADVGEAVSAYGGDRLAELEPNPDPAPVPVRNLFEDRDTSKPFDISLTEFCNVEPGWMQLTLHYYALENIVTDDKDEPVPAYFKLCGPIDVDMFGANDLSEDPTIIYRRNIQTGADYEIILRAESYNEKVFGVKEPE